MSLVLDKISTALISESGLVTALASISSKPCLSGTLAAVSSCSRSATMRARSDTRIVAPTSSAIVIAALAIRVIAENPVAAIV
jgi:hypothetical protein